MSTGYSIQRVLEAAGHMLFPLPELAREMAVSWFFGTQCLLLNEHHGAIQEWVERWSRKGPPGGSRGGQGRAVPPGERSFFGGALAAGFFA